MTGTSNEEFKVRTYNQIDYYIYSSVTHRYFYDDNLEGRWNSRSEAQQVINNYERKQMNNTQVKLDQVTKDIKHQEFYLKGLMDRGIALNEHIGLLQVEADLLAKKIEDEKVVPLKAGDVVDYCGYKRIIIRSDKLNILEAYSEDGYWMGSEHTIIIWKKYKKIGRIEDYIK